MKEPFLLQTKGLTKKYRDAKAVDSVDMTVREGDIYGFIGQNGAGKTTVIRLITSLITPTSGEISLFGKSDPAGLAEGRKRIGCIVESPALFPTLSARDNLEYYRIQRGMPDAAVVKDALESVNLADTGKKPARQFSFGMKQRLGLALAVMGKPDFLILDEPINGLDPMGIVEVRDILLRLNRERRMSILISSHILSELAHVATRYGIIHSGRLIKEIDNPEEMGSDIEGYYIKTVNQFGGRSVHHE
jgi:ABC-2 type transport system ATP-binding protein